MSTLLSILTKPCVSTFLIREVFLVYNSVFPVCVAIRTEATEIYLWL